MSNAWSLLWSQARVRLAQAADSEEKPLTHLFGGVYSSHPSPLRFKVQPGDSVYVVSVRRKQLFLLARLTVARVVTLAEWARQIADEGEPAEVQALKALAQAPAPDPRKAFDEWREKSGKSYLVPSHVYSDVVAEGTGTTLRFDVAVPQTLLPQIYFLTSSGESPLLAPGDTQIKLTQLQGMYRRLTPASGRLLDTVLAGEADLPGFGYMG